MTKPRLLTIPHALLAQDIKAAADYMLGLHPDDVDEYTHPFEPKLQVKKARHRDTPLESLIEFMRCNALTQLLNGSMDVPWQEVPAAGSEYFTAAYIYREEDYLQTHLDCAIHDGERKVITANLYLTDADGGELDIRGHTVAPEANTLVAFVNDDDSWHAVRRIKRGLRLMITTGYVLPADMFPMAGFNATYEKAWFGPGPGEQWGDEEYALRDKRAGLRM